MAGGYVRGAPAVPQMALRRVVALGWGNVQIVGSVAAGFAVYLALVTVVLPGEQFDGRAWAASVASRWLFAAPGALGLAIAFRAVNRAVFGWIHLGEPAPEPRALFRLLVGSVATGLVVGTAESFFVNRV